MPESHTAGSGRRSNRSLRVGTLAVALAVVSAGLATGTPWRQGPRALPIDDVAAACNTDNPFVAMACVDTVLVFQDTANDQPHYPFGRRPAAPRSDIGAVWGLAYSSRENAIYAAATHRRGVAFGPGGPGAVYRIDLASGDIAQPITVPDAGSDHHFPDARGSDAAARYWAGKTSLGDIDFDERETELFVANLDDRHIYRFSVPDGRLIGSFPHGGAGEDWAEDARPWGLAVRGGTLFHGVVNSAESTRRRDEVEAVVYASRLDGSAMHAAYRAGLGYERPKPLMASGQPRTGWNPWQSIALGQQIVVHPMPVLSDIGFAADGDLYLGLKDRLGDMVAPSAIVDTTRVGRDPDSPEAGIPLGDALVADLVGPTWMAPDFRRLHQDRQVEPTWFQGGLAAVAGTDSLVLGAMRQNQGNGTGHVGERVALWFRQSESLPSGDELLCVEPPRARARRPGTGTLRAAPIAAPALDNGEQLRTHVLLPVPGDVEVLCAPTVHPTPTPTLTPRISPTPSATRTASPTRTATSTPTSTTTPSPTTTPTRVPGPVYLPIAVSEPPCLPVRPILDVILILDASTSMADLTRAGRPKIDAAVAAARDFVARLALAPDGDHAALVAFNVAATLEAPLTADRAALDAALDGIALAQFTRIDLGLDAAAAELASTRRRPGATAAVILLTDGRSNPVPVSEAERAAEAVKATGARLFTIGLGQDLDADALRRMASRPQDYFEAPDGEDLAAIYEVIAAALPCPPYAHWPIPAAALGRTSVDAVGAVRHGNPDSTRRGE